MAEYKAAVRLRKEDDPNLTITVRNHQTYSMADPAMLIFDKSDIVTSEAYIHIASPQILHDRLPLNIFLS